MKNTTSTFYAVRVIRYYVNSDRDPEVYWVQRDNGYGQGARNWSLGSQEKAYRWPRITKAKAALKYACVRDELERTRVRDEEATQAMIDKKGKHYFCRSWPHYPTLKVRHEAEVVKITEHVTYDEPEIIDALPKRSALEQIARAGENSTLLLRPT